jgi:hypothetical protein
VREDILMLADYHVHTEFSDDSREPMEEQVKKAVSLGLKEMCFTDHVDYGIKKDWDEGNIEYRGGDGMGHPAGTQEQPLQQGIRPPLSGGAPRHGRGGPDRRDL